MIKQLFDSLGETQIQALVQAKVWRVYFNIFSDLAFVILTFLLMYGIYRLFRGAIGD